MDYVKKITTDLIEKILSKGVRDMPQNPAAQGYDERQIRAFYYLPEKQILITMSMIEEGLVKELEKLQTNGVSVKFGEHEGTAYEGHKGKQNADDIVELKQKVDNLETPEIDLTEYQTKTDNSLDTTDKTIVGAINEVNEKVGQGGSGGGKLYKHSVTIRPRLSDFIDEQYPGSDETGYFYPAFSFTYYSSSSDIFVDLLRGGNEVRWSGFFAEISILTITNEGGGLTDSYMVTINDISYVPDDDYGTLSFDFFHFQDPVFLAQYRATFYNSDIYDIVTEV